MPAYQGFDALFHSTKCYISAAANMMSDMYALTAIENVGAYLARAVEDGNDMESREPQDFIIMLVKPQNACGVADLKMSHYGIQRNELDKMAKNARDTMDGIRRWVKNHSF
ncbi:dehydroquinate synthase/iron-containing alcohol dehydrogenase family protein [Clostridium moutaii]|uniref:iron-containing alcohol dehydrogenase n=1 Tax=Clostridium moutaii TaxID=3240932 RepID=UPI00387EAA58